MNYTAAQRLDRLPEASFHRRLTMLVGAGLFFDAFDLYMASGIMVALTASGWSTVAMNAQFVSAGALGALIGAIFAGWLGDRYGRRFSFQFNLILFGVTSLAAALAPSMDSLIVLRLIMGIGLGAEIVVGYATVAEFVPPRSRGRWGAILFFLATAALLASHLVGYLVIPRLGWRWMFGIAGIGGLIVWFLRKQLPESPRWLESVGRHAEADAILCHIEASVTRELGRPLPMPVHTSAHAPKMLSLIDLFKPPLLRSTTLGVTINVVSLSVVYGFIIWLPTFLSKQGLSLPHSIGYSALMSAGSLIGIVLAGNLTDRWSRKKLLIANSMVAAALGLYYPHAGTIVATSVVGFLLITCLYVSGTVGFSTYLPELFPTEVRLRGSAVSSAAGRGASIAMPLVVGMLLPHYGVEGVTMTMVGLIVLQAVMIGWLGFDTTGRSIDSSFHGGH